ncbi:hypothetical protein QC764_204090 [Podospora pseudoanserina]|uniref:Methyltransferase type 11 domain-containing protein n=1 Tax=Podospora pseudoanserina TaxID=2609844 RepID=A0ABR0IG91_9PEZI|nr:hypothetical protein QC764_204090 [Podospora pseudoanserina]
MEFLSGYAAAQSPFSAYTVEPPPNSSHRSRSKQPGRSNSTSGTQTKKRSRIHGHARTNSASTSSTGSGRTGDSNQQPSHPGHHHGTATAAASNNNINNNPAWLQHPGAPDAARPGVDAAAASPAAVTAPPFSARRDRHRERMSYQDKQLPATPRLNTVDASSRSPGSGSASEPASAQTPASASAAFSDRRMLHHAAAAMYDPGSKPPGPGPAGLPRSESVTSVGGVTTASGRTMISTEPPSSQEAAAHQLRPFVIRNGRTYISDQSLPYPLPVDLEELHRQNLKTMLLLQLYGRPICDPTFINKPPPRILEIGCGTGFWSMTCYRYYEARGQHANMSFTGLDIVPLAPPTGGPGVSESAESAPSALPGASAIRPDKDMNWTFVQHDLRKLPLPFPEGSFDFVMVKDMGLATSMVMQQGLVDEYIRVLVPGGTVEIWETDHTLRMLRPHVPEPPAGSGGAEGEAEDGDEAENGNDEQNIMEMGAYLMTANTPLSQPLNNFLLEYNGWISRTLEARGLFCMPCTVIGPLLIQEAEVLTGVGSTRLAIPLSEVRWEREGVGGVVTKDGKSYIDTKTRRLGKDGAPVGKALGPVATAVRRTALTVVVQQIQSMEHVLREVSGKSQDEWDAWMGKMMNDLVRENGPSWGECLEVGAWWAKKR